MYKHMCSFALRDTGPQGVCNRAQGPRQGDLQITRYMYLCALALRVHCQGPQEPSNHHDTQARRPTAKR